MPEQLQKIINIVLEWWNKFTSRQRTMIIAISAGIIMTLAILLVMMNQTQYIPLVTAISAKEASEIKDILDADGTITYRTSADSLRFEVDKKQQALATMLLGANDVQSSVWSIDNVTSGGFSTTEADKYKRYVKYLESQISNMAMNLTAVKSATTILNMPENTGTLLSQEKDSSALIMLELKSELTEEQAAAFAKGISVGLGSDTPLDITILDNSGNLLFSGHDIYSAGGSASNQLSVKNKSEDQVNNNVRRVLMGTDEFTKVVVASNLVLDFGSTKITENVYGVADGRDEGFIADESHYDSESTMGNGGIPGTDSNREGGPTYQWPDYANSSSTESERTIKRLVDQTITETELPPGGIVWNESSIAVTASSLKIVREEDVRNRGELDGVTWEQYKDANSERTMLPVSQEMYSSVANASGIPLANISILSYIENHFIDDVGMQISWTDVTQIILIVIILGLLGFVVIRSMRSGRQEDEEEELSVEKLLQSQPELEDISIDEGTEAKKLIDKFVEDNPEAAASLLRNWLNEDWG
ncbi:MAG: flagellar M-ring protein FliF [Lachnospiraceae bacterium]|nr:flagellar M-ring protein FliF [Lachnospiraceae bacterium]